MKSFSIIGTGLVMAFVMFAGMSDAGAQGKDSAKSDKMQMHKSMSGHDHMSMTKDKKTDKKNESIVRKGVIDVRALDKNKDGKVYQDQMDWNVISDKPGKCPLCNMTLKEVSVDKAVENLKANGFKVKK